MRWIKLLIKVVMVSFTLNLPHGKRSEFTPTTQTERTIEKKKRKTKTRKKKEKEIPRHRQINKRNYKGTQSKDKRYSNQRMIRRMYRNS